jgi:hypothetical protein
MSQTVEATGASASVAQIAAGWLDDLAAAVERADATAVGALHVADGWWRDLLALTWDLRTLHGSEAIVAMLAERLPEAGCASPA